MAPIQRVLLKEEPFVTDIKQFPWDRGRPDALWIAHPESHTRPWFSEFLLEISGPYQGHIHVSADERYHLFLNGELIYRGPERGDEENWYFETFALDLPPGKHTLTAFVWSLGDDHAPFAQVIVEHGFLVMGDPRFATGHAPWKVRRVTGIEMIPRTATYGCGDRFRFVPSEPHPWIEPKKGHKPFIEGAGDTQPTRILRMSRLPDMHGAGWDHYSVRHISEPKDRNTPMVAIRAADHLKEEQGAWEGFFRGRPLSLPPKSRRRIIVDLTDYVCAYWKFSTTGGTGSTVRVSFQESLWDDPAETKKGNRDAIEGKYFCHCWHKSVGEGDEVLVGEAKTHTTLWWLAGRYMELYVETGDESLTLQWLGLEQSHYPILPQQAPFRCSDERLNKVVDICLRTLQMDMHQTYMDTPFYEQLMYVGDTRVEAMCTMAITDDDRLPRKATELFFWSRGPRGITQSRYPSRNRQHIPPFSLFWVMMVADQLHWRGDHEFARRMVPGVRSVLDAFEQLMDENGLMRSHAQWNFLDWIPGWPVGVPPEGTAGFNTAHNLQLVLALESAAWLEKELGNKSYASYLSDRCQHLRAAILKHLVKDGHLIDGLGAETVSEHPHALASLCGDKKLVDIGKRWYDTQPEGPRATYYFQHYRFEALAKFGRHPQILEDIRKEWGAMVDLGLKTCLESPDPSRSDCHAWSSHPILHLQQSIAGIRLKGPGLYSLEPHLCDLDWLEAHIATGKGLIHVHVDKKEIRLEIPEGVTIMNGPWIGPTSVSVPRK